MTGLAHTARAHRPAFAAVVGVGLFVDAPANSRTGWAGIEPSLLTSCAPKEAGFASDAADRSDASPALSAGTGAARRVTGDVGFAAVIRVPVAVGVSAVASRHTLSSYACGGAVRVRADDPTRAAVVSIGLPVRAAQRTSASCVESGLAADLGGAPTTDTEGIGVPRVGVSRLAAASASTGIAQEVEALVTAASQPWVGAHYPARMVRVEAISGWAVEGAPLTNHTFWYGEAIAGHARLVAVAAARDRPNARADPRPAAPFLIRVRTVVAAGGTYCAFAAAAFRRTVRRLDVATVHTRLDQGFALALRVACVAEALDLALRVALAGRTWRARRRLTGLPV